jgi:L-threonine kinase
VQGVLPDGREFQVTLPIDLFSSAHVVASDGPEWVVEVEPRDRHKAAAAAEATARKLESSPLRLTVTIDSAIPVGAGLGSSTADIVATVRATAGALAATLTPHEVGHIAGAIEPSDGTMHAGMCVTDRRGGLIEMWPWAPSFHLVVLVPEGRSVATEAVVLDRQRDRAGSYAQILEDLRAATRRRDPRPFVEAAMCSATMNQDVLANPLLARASEFRWRTGAAGWNVAHTGTALGLLFHDHDQATAAASELRRDAKVGGLRLLRASVVARPEGR